jgi:hypothetical protein
MPAIDGNQMPPEVLVHHSNTSVIAVAKAAPQQETRHDQEAA